MKRTYRVELDIVVDEANAALAIQLAREQYHASGHASEPICDGSDDLRDISPEEFIPDITSALMELAGAHPLFHKVGIEVTDIACREIEPVGAATAQ